MYWLVARYVVVNFNMVAWHNSKLAVTEELNFTDISSNEPKKYVFNMVVTEGLNFAVMRMLGSQQDRVNRTFYPSFKNIL